MIRLQPTQITNAQQLTATVTGPDGANTLIVFDGSIPANVSAWNNATSKETYSVLLGPVLTRRQFVQATATASLGGLGVNLNAAGSLIASWQIPFVDADWDDESGQVELRVEVSTQVGANASTNLLSVGYHVTVLAAM